MKSNALIPDCVRHLAIFKRRLFLCIVALGAASFARTADATGIELISSQRHTWGDWAESWLSYGNDSVDEEWHTVSGTFDITSVTAEADPSFTSIVSSPHGWERGSSSVGAWSLAMTSDSAPMGIPFVGGLGALNPSAVNISSTATSLFRVNDSRIAVNLQGDSHFNYLGWEQEMGVSLKDVTSAGTLLFSIYGLGQEVLSPFNYSYVFDVDPSHTYELEIFGRINSWDSKGVNMYTSVHLAPYVSVPDSTGCVLGMLIISFLGVIWMGRKMER